jgi:hypothetical protein
VPGFFFASDLSRRFPSCGGIVTEPSDRPFTEVHGFARELLECDPAQSDNLLDRIQTSYFRLALKAGATSDFALDFSANMVRMVQRMADAMRRSRT